MKQLIRQLTLTKCSLWMTAVLAGGVILWFSRQLIQHYGSRTLVQSFLFTATYLIFFFLDGILTECDPDESSKSIRTSGSSITLR